MEKRLAQGKDCRSQAKSLKTLLDYARWYVFKGIPVIPIKHKDKKPAIFSWKEFQERLPSDDELTKWFSNGSNYNIAIITGKLSGIVAVDLDSDRAVEFAKSNNFPPTPLSKTGRGYHALYKYKQGVRNFQKRDDLPDIDLRGEGGYVVVEPSIHPSGHRYKWIDGKGIDDLPFAELPDIILAKKSEDKTPLKELYNGVPEGSRNDTLAKLAGSWAHDGLSFDECVENARLWNEKNSPPMDSREIHRTVKSIFERHQKTSVNQEWPEPIPFDDFSVLPDFPVELLPGIGRETVKVVSEVNQVDPGLAALNYLSVLSACLGKKAVVNLISHTEPLNIFTCAIYESGNRKSTTQAVMTRPLYDYQEQAQKEMQDLIRDSLNAYKIREGRLARLQKQAAQTDDYDKRKQFEVEAAAVAKEIEENPVVKTPLFVMDDTTTEALAIHMAENRETMAIFSTEGGIFQTMAGRYDKGVNIDLYLKAHSGDPFSVHRIGRESKTMQSPCLTICLTVQPDVIREIGGNEQFRGRGLLARFIYVYCKSHVGYRQRQIKSIPEPLLNEYRHHIGGLMDIPAGHELRLSAEAHAIWDEFYNDIEIEMRPGGSLEYLADWGSKLPGAVARIAGLLHFAEHGAEGIRKDISAGIAGASCVIGAYFKEQALATFGLMQADHRIESAKRTLSYIVRQNPDSFKGRDIIRHSNFKTMDDVLPGLKVLIERGYIRETETARSGTGRPEAIIYEVNPKIKMNALKNP